MPECWEFRLDSKGRPAKVCVTCTYYTRRKSGALNEKTACWDYQKCTQACAYHRQTSPLKTQIVSNTCKKEMPQAQTKQVLPVISQNKNKSILVQRTKNPPVSVEKENSDKNQKGRKNATSEKAYKLIAQALRIMIKT